MEMNGAVSNAIFCDACPMRRCFKSLVSRTSVLYNVHTFLHQTPNSTVNGVSRSTGLFGGHRCGEIKSSVSCCSSWTVSQA